MKRKIKVITEYIFPEVLVGGVPQTKPKSEFCQMFFITRVWFHGSSMVVATLASSHTSMVIWLIVSMRQGFGS